MESYSSSSARGQDGSISLEAQRLCRAWLAVILPIVFTHRLDQWIDNARVLLRLLYARPLQEGQAALATFAATRTVKYGRRGRSAAG